MIHQILHTFGIHNWSRWSDPSPLASGDGLTSAFAGEQKAIAQGRVCDICNFQQQIVIGFEYYIIKDGFKIRMTNFEEK
jgi:hypothetical protein